MIFELIFLRFYINFLIAFFRLLEAQIATGGLIDPQAGHRVPIQVAYDRGLFDARMNKILEDPNDDTKVDLFILAISKYLLSGIFRPEYGRESVIFDAAGSLRP